MSSSAVLLFLLSFGHMCTDIVQGALPALLPFLKERFDLSYAVTGTLLMAAHLTSSVIQPLFGYVTDRRPFPILLPLGCAISGVGIALVPLSPSFGWLVAFVMFTGLGTAAFHPEGFKATACIASERRATGMSFFSVGGNLGWAIGSPAAIFLVSRYGLPGASGLLIPTAVAALLFLPALPAIRKRIESISTAPRKNAMSGVEHPLYAVTLIVLIVVLRSWTQLGLATYIPFLYQAQLKTDPAYVATLLFFFLGSGTVGTVIGGPLADRFGHRRLLFFSVLLQIPLIFLFLRSSGVTRLRLGRASGRDDRLHLLGHDRDGPGAVPEADGDGLGHHRRVRHRHGRRRRHPDRGGRRPVRRAGGHAPDQRPPRDRRPARPAPAASLEGRGGALTAGRRERDIGLADRESLRPLTAQGRPAYDWPYRLSTHSARFPWRLPWRHAPGSEPSFLCLPNTLINDIGGV